MIAARPDRLASGLRAQLDASLSQGTVVSSSASGILEPFLADQRDEADAAEVLPFGASAGELGHLDQLLRPGLAADRHDQPPALDQLVDQRLGYMTAARRRQYRVERRVVRAAAGAVA